MVVIDSSSLILMAKTGILDIVVRSLHEKLVMTGKVYDESTSKTVAFDAMLIKKRVEERVIEKVELENRALSRKVRADFNVGEGEAEAIALCIGSGSGLITDDKKAMNACRLLGIKFTTAPNLLVAIYKSGLVTKAEANAYMGKLQKAGRYSGHIARQISGELK